MNYHFLISYINYAPYHSPYHDNSARNSGTSLSIVTYTLGLAIYCCNIEVFLFFKAKNVLVPRTPVGKNQFLALVWSRFKIRLAQYIMEVQFIVSWGLLREVSLHVYITQAGLVKSLK